MTFQTGSTGSITPSGTTRFTGSFLGSTRPYINMFDDEDKFNEVPLEEVKDLIVHNIKTATSKVAIRNSIRAVLY